MAFVTDTEIDVPQKTKEIARGHFHEQHYLRGNYKFFAARFDCIGTKSTLVGINRNPLYLILRGRI